MDYRDEEYACREEEREVLLEVCTAVMFRTIRDLVNYRRQGKRSPLYRDAFDWVFCYHPADEDQPYTFAWMCEVLGWSHEQTARVIHMGLNEQGSYEALRQRLQTMPRTRGAGGNGVRTD